MATPEAPAEARLIDEAQKSAVPALSMRKAAEMAGMSDGRWRQIVKGYQGTGTGKIPVIAPDETLARMALVVGVTDSQLESAGRPEAAGVLRLLLASSERPDVALAQVSTDRLLSELRRRIEGSGYVDSPSTATESGAPGQARQSEKTLPGTRDDREPARWSGVDGWGEHPSVSAAEDGGDDHSLGG